MTSETASSAPHGLPSATHAPLQSTIPGAHRHAPPWHVWSGEHGMPQPPQFVASFATSTHRWPHAVCAAAQLGAVQLMPPASLEQAAAINATPPATIAAAWAALTPGYATSFGAAGEER